MLAVPVTVKVPKSGNESNGVALIVIVALEPWVEPLAHVV
jgi:hypothetical protein